MTYRIIATGDTKYPYAIKYKYTYWPIWFWLRNSCGDWTPRAGFKTKEEAENWIVNDKTGRRVNGTIVSESWQ
jgi:hypothetical protein